MGYKVYFGGTYKENWTEDYTMSVSYSDRKYVIAEKTDKCWIAVGGDSELAETVNSADSDSLIKKYFIAAAEVYSALNDCSERGLSFERLWEIHHFNNLPLASAELMRILMDDCGFSLYKAFDTAAQCCCDLKAEDIDTQAMYYLQPRDAHIVSIMRSSCDEILTVRHDSRSDRYRSAYGAVKTGDKVILSLDVMTGKAENVELYVYGDELSLTVQTSKKDNTYTAEFTAPEKPAALWYCFTVKSAQENKYVCADKSGWFSTLSKVLTEGFRLTVYDRNFETPEWFKNSVMYQIFPDRFAFSDDGTAERGIEYHKKLGQNPELHGGLDEEVRYLPRSFEKDYIPDDFYGGTLNGIAGKLGYLKSLGISCIYLNPIVEARSNHRYDTADYYKVDPILGTDEDFESLCSKAEEKGIRIILDGVFSHTGADSVYFNRYGHYPTVGACQNRNSRYYSWYDFKSYPDDYRCWWGFKELPEVNESDPTWQDNIISSADSVVKTWLRRGSSGWRLDVADELPDEVLSLIRKSAKEERPDALVLGEVWEDAVIKESYSKRRNYALGCSLDSVMNYPLREAIIDFVKGKTDAYELRDFLISQQMNYPPPLYYSLMNLMGSHDMPRLRTCLASDAIIRSLSREEQLKLSFSQENLEWAVTLEKLCAAIQFTLPGVPSIYYGDEQGMEGVSDPFNRRPYRENDCGLENFYRELAQLRNNSYSLRLGEAKFFACNKNVVAIVRYVPYNQCVSGENTDYLIIINRSNANEIFSVDCSFCSDGVICGEIESFSEKIYPLSKKSNDTDEKLC